MFSFWEQNTFIKSPDVVVIGSGIVGLNAAISLKKKSPRSHILILERGMLPYGASTRNAGFACFGSISELLSDLTTQPEDEVFSLVERRYSGLQQLRKLLGDDKIIYEPLGGFEVFREEDEKIFRRCAEAIERFNRNVSGVTGSKNTYRIADEKISSFGLNKVSHLIENTAEGQIDTGQMMKSLLSLAYESGVVLLNGAEVTQITEDEKSATIHLGDRGGKEKRHIACKRVVICVNGFARKFLPEFDVQPARAQVLVTSPIPGLKVSGSFHYDQGYYYFRNIGNRILLGGGRNLDFDGETTEEMVLTGVIQNKLETLLDDMIIPTSNYTIDMRWSGIMGLGADKTPIIKQTGKNIFCAVRLGGMGVAIGTLVGNEVAGLVHESLQ